VAKLKISSFSLQISLILKSKVFTYWCYKQEEISLFTYSMGQNLSWEANQFEASQHIPHILWNQKVHYHIHKGPPTPPNWTSSIQSIPPHPTSWRSILILSSHLCLCLPSGLSLRFPHQNLEYASPLLYTSYMPRPLHSSQFYHPKNIV